MFGFLRGWSGDLSGFFVMSFPTFWGCLVYEYLFICRNSNEVMEDASYRFLRFFRWFKIVLAVVTTLLTLNRFYGNARRSLYEIYHFLQSNGKPMLNEKDMATRNTTCTTKIVWERPTDPHTWTATTMQICSHLAPMFLCRS